MNFWETATQLSGFNETLVDELNSKKILLIGAGGLAHPLVTSLCGSGLTTFDIADGDVIESVSYTHLTLPTIYSV